MELVVLEEKKQSMAFELKGEKHTFPNLLCWALLRDPKVKLAVYEPGHPLIGHPKIRVETNAKAPRKAISDALDRITKELTALKRAVGQA